jgi:hypothetical protein
MSVDSSSSTSDQPIFAVERRKRGADSTQEDNCVVAVPKRKRHETDLHIDFMFHAALYVSEHTSKCVIFRLPPESIVPMLSVTKRAREKVLNSVMPFELLRTFFPYAAVPASSREAVAVFCMLANRRPTDLLSAREGTAPTLLLGPRCTSILVRATSVVLDTQWPLAMPERQSKCVLDDGFYTRREEDVAEKAAEIVYLATHEDQSPGNALRRFQLMGALRDHVTKRQCLYDALCLYNVDEHRWIDVLSLAVSERRVKLSPCESGTLSILDVDGERSRDLSVPRAMLKQGRDAFGWSSVGEIHESLCVVSFARELALVTDNPPATLPPRSWRLMQADRVLYGDIPDGFLHVSFDEVRKVLYVVEVRAVLEIDLSDMNSVTAAKRKFTNPAFCVTRKTVVLGSLLVDVSATLPDGHVWRPTAGLENVPGNTVATADFRNLDERGRIVLHRYHPRVGGTHNGVARRQAVVAQPGNLLVAFFDIAGYHYPHFVAKPMPWELDMTRMRDEAARRV